MQLPIEEWKRLLRAAERTNRPINIDWESRTITILDSDQNGALKLYVIRDKSDGTAQITDRINE